MIKQMVKKGKRLNPIYTGIVAGIIFGILKVPIFLILGEWLPSFIGNLLSIVPDEILCHFLKLKIGEECGFFIVIYGFVYNPIFYGIVGGIIGFLYGVVKRNVKEKVSFSIFFVFGIIFIITPLVQGYDITPAGPVHQYLSNESQETWRLIQPEIKMHLLSTLSRTTNDNDYNTGDDIIDGSREEDLPLFELRFFRHFWQPDSPRNGSYDDGLNFGIEFESSYRRAQRYWNDYVIPLYLEGRTDESYYWLGRVAHLLEDAAQPGHVLLDPHCPYPFFCQNASILESYTGSNFTQLRNTYNWRGENFREYSYDNLIDNFDWTKVEPNIQPSDKQNIELFRLFWYTAQKTQYWASDDVNGNQIYRDLNGNTLNWQCGTSSSLNLWKNESYSCSYIINASANLNSNTVDKEANKVEGDYS